MRLATVAFFFFVCQWPVSSDNPQIPWRGVWEWSMDKKSDAGLTAIADACQRLGFNALMMYPPRDRMQFMADECHKRGIKLYLSTVFSGGDNSWQQVLTPEERERASRPPPANYQQGGEPVSPDEIGDHPLPCWNRPEVRDYFRKVVADSARLPVDGLAFDFVGYQNYLGCHCPVCGQKLADYRRQQPRLTEKEAFSRFAEQTMVDFIAEMAKAARQARPDIGLTIHVYPWFAPHPYYGNRLDVDYVGQTVSWFFPPHWPLEKVRRRTREIVATQHKFYKRHFAAPFIAFYSDTPQNLRSPDRVRSELDIVRASGARAIQMAELGHLVRAPEVAEVVAKKLGRSLWK